MVLLPLKPDHFAPWSLLLYPEDGGRKATFQKTSSFLIYVCVFLCHYKLVLNCQFWNFSFYWYPWVTGMTLLRGCHHLQLQCIPICLHPVGIRAIDILFTTTNSLRHIFILFIVYDHIFISYFPIFLLWKLPNITVTSRVVSSRIECRVVCWKSADVSEEHVGSSSYSPLWGPQILHYSHLVRNSWFVLWHADPLLGSDCKPLLSNSSDRTDSMKTCTQYKT
jgi:hypothetical protein